MTKPQLHVIVSAAALVLVLALTLGLTGCGESSSAGDPPTTSTMQLETTTSAPTTTSTPTTSAPSTTASSGATTEPLSDAETRLPNGHIQAMGLIHQIGDINQKNYIWINYAVLLTGDAATAAAIEAGVIAPGEELDTDYFIAKKDPERQQFEVSDSVAIRTSTYEGVTDRLITWDEFRSYWSSSAAPDTVYLRDAPWWIERDGNMVVKIDEQYLP